MTATTPSLLNSMSRQPLGEMAHLHVRRVAAVPRGVASGTSIYVAHARNGEVWDVEGRRYIDFAGGIGAANTGHVHPKVLEAAERQMRAFAHVAFQVAGYEPYIRLAERLNAAAPAPKPCKTLLVSTGAEAVENAVKIARAFTGRPGIVSFEGAFHGRTFMTMALTGKVAPYKIGFGPFPSDVYHVPFPGRASGTSAEDSIKALERLFNCSIEPARIAALIVEPVQGEGGFNIAPFSFLKRLREICSTHGILLIADEIQTGFGRTGRLFGIEHSEIEADLVVMAKSLGGGFPLAAVTGRSEVMDAVAPGGLGGTFGGNPVACAAANAVLDIIDQEDLCARARKIGELVMARFNALKSRKDVGYIGEVRGLGAMCALELVDSINRTARDLAALIISKAAERGLILLKCGMEGNVIRVLVPLTASDAIVQEGLDTFDAILREVS